MRGRLRFGARLACLAGCLSLFLACAPPPREVPADAVAKAQAALEPFKAELMQTLMAALDGGPANAISVCRERAPEIAARVAADGVEMGRTSQRLRNPANAPQPWVEPLLEWYLDHPTERAGRAVQLDDARFGYVEPIELKPFCLSCHGPAVDPELYATIRELYPTDQATGFVVGDLRGLFWVTMPLAGSG